MITVLQLLKEMVWFVIATKHHKMSFPPPPPLPLDYIYLIQTRAYLIFDNSQFSLYSFEPPPPKKKKYCQRVDYLP